MSGRISRQSTVPVRNDDRTDLNHSPLCVRGSFTGTRARVTAYQLRPLGGLQGATHQTLRLLSNSP